MEALIMMNESLGEACRDKIIIIRRNVRNKRKL